MTGTSLHYLGNQTDARHHIERALSGYVNPDRRRRLNRYQFDQRVTAQATLARIFWIQGFPDQAVLSAETSVEKAQASEHVLTLCNALVQAACPVAFFVGDLAAAERCAAMLLEHSERHGLAYWHARGRGFKGMLVNKAGNTAAGLPLLRSTLEELRDTRYAGHYMALLGVFAETLGRCGQAADGLFAIDEALAQSDRTEARVRVAELLRVKGELLLLQDSPNAVGMAEEHFLRALDWAREQGALSWELRAASSLARLRQAQEGAKAARELLAPIYDRFTEGFGTADLQTAEAILSDLQ